MAKNHLIFILLATVILFFGCSYDIPEGKGKIVIENEMTDACYIEKVWIRKCWNFGWNLEYDDGDVYNKKKFVKIHPEPGEYSIRLRVYYLDAIPVEFYTFLLTSVDVKEGETLYLKFDGFSIHK